MTAGAGTWLYRRRRPCVACLIVLMVPPLAFLLGALTTPGAGTARASSPPVVTALTGWETFSADCIAGPSPGQGSSASACVCWERNLQAQAIEPDYAVGALNAAQIGGGDAYTVSQNLAGGAVGWAMQGCGLNEA